MEPRSTVVLAISRQMGSGGSYIGHGVANRLGLKYVDREILAGAAKLLGTEDQSLEHLEEHVANTWVKFTRHLSLGPPDALFTPPRIRETVFEEDLFQIESQIIREIAARENCVIIGRGGSFVLRQHPGVIRLFVHAAESWRVDTLMRGGTMSDRQQVRDLIRKSDHDRARFVQGVCGCDWSQSCHYDLTINTSKIGLDPAVDLVTTIVERRLREVEGTPGVKKAG